MNPSESPPDPSKVPRKTPPPPPARSDNGSGASERATPPTTPSLSTSRIGRAFTLGKLAARAGVTAAREALVRVGNRVLGDAAGEDSPPRPAPEVGTVPNVGKTPNESEALSTGVPATTAPFGMGGISTTGAPVPSSSAAVPTSTGRQAMVAALVKLHGEQAKRMVEELAQMKGLAMKAGQILSYVDGLVPEEVAPVYREALRTLQANAPHFPPDSVREVVVSDFGRPPEFLFDEFESTPIAAASIGQVHRAKLPDGTPVAVKIQYPGVAEAIRADLANASLFETLMGPLAGRFNVSGPMREAVRTVADELDYPKEARHQRRFAHAFRDHPHIVVPRVYDDFTRARVLTSQWIDGLSFHDFQTTATPEQQAEAGRILFGAVWEGMLVHGLFNADPHPGNYLFLPDGRVALIDFGCVRQFSAAFSRGSVAFYEALLNKDGEGVDRALSKHFNVKEPHHRKLVLEFLHFVLRFATESRFTFTPQFARDCVNAHVEMAATMTLRHFSAPSIPPEFYFLSRLQFGFFSVLGALGATGSFQAILRDIVGRAQRHFS